MKIQIFKIAAVAVAFAVALACGKDDITEIEAGTSSADTSQDNIDNESFDRTVYVTYSSSGNATVTGTTDNLAITISGNGVTIVNNSSDKVQYELSGSTSNGFLKIYSLKKQALYLKGVSITNPSGAAINIQGSSDSLSKAKRTYVVLSGSNSVADGSSYTATPSNEDEKAAIFSEGVIVFSGSGSLAVSATGKSGIASDDYLHFISGTVTVNMTSAAKVLNGDTLKPACLKGKEDFIVSGGTITLTSSGSGAKGISGDGTASFAGGTVTVNVTGSNFGSSNSGGGMGPGGGGSSSSGVSAKGIKFDSGIAFSGSTVTVSASSHEAIESKGALSVTGGVVYAYSASDDAINSTGDMTVSGGYLGAYSTSNDAMDANGDMYIDGGVVFAISTAGGAEVAMDANTEGGKQLYVQGGTLVAIGGLEQGASLSQSCYQASSASSNTWYAITVGSSTFAFKTPSLSSNGGGMGPGGGGGGGSSAIIVSGSSQPSLKSGVSVSGGTNYFNSTLNVGGTYSGGSTVSLNSYSGGNSGGMGPRDHN